jgi:type IV pilus assembly protein PilE
MKEHWLVGGRAMSGCAACAGPLAAASSRGVVGGRESSRGQVGFSLIELMIVVAIIAILAAIAFPTYTRYTIKTHRVAAEGCLSQYASYMERYYTTNLRYDKDAGGVANTPPVLDCATSSQQSYTLPAAAASAGTYTLTATPVGMQLAKDTECGTLTLDQAGTRLASGPGGVAQCW